jgi:hypothetical protein
MVTWQSNRGALRTAVSANSPFVLCPSSLLRPSSLLPLFVACCLVTCGCDDAIPPTDNVSSSGARRLPPPPPPAGAPAPQPAVTPATPDPAPSVDPAGDAGDTEDDAADEDPPPTDVTFHTEEAAPEARPLTSQEAKAAVEDLGGRVSVDESGNSVSVFLNRTSINDDQIEVVQYLPDLQVLNLTGTPVGDTGLRHVHGLSKLQRVYAAHTEISDEGVRQLKQALPDCEVYR